MTEGGERHRDARRIVVAGDGLTGWMAAATLAQVLPARDWSIRVVRVGDDLPTFGFADATLPLSQPGLDGLLPDEDALIERTGGAFTWGIALAGWAAAKRTRFHAFGATGAALGSVTFHHLALRLRSAGTPVKPANYSLAALAAQAGRFARPDRDPHSVLSSCRYGLHLDCEALAAILRDSALEAGVTAARGDLERTEMAADGTVAAVITGDGRRIEGDLFLDCSGPRARLIGETLQADWQDWSAWLPCDRMQVAVTGTGAAPLPYSIASAHRAGWIREVPLQGRTALAGFLRVDAGGPGDGLARLGEVAGRRIDGVREHAVRFGRRSHPWLGNCIALGAAAALLDPVVVGNLHLLVRSLHRLRQLLPGADGSTRALAAEYNRQTGAELDCARDFTMLHYKLNGRHGEPLWDACRDMRLPESLDYRLRLYGSRARVVMYDHEIFEETDWAQLFDEHGVQARRYNPAADGLQPAQIEAHLARVRELMLEALGGMPTHAEFLAALPASRGAGDRR